MSNRFATASADLLYESITPHLRASLQYVNKAAFDTADSTLDGPRALIASARAATIDDVLLSDLYVLDRYVAVLSSYARTWRLIVEGDFKGSWGALQDTLDSLRLVKRFSAVDVSFFEDQLVELEGCYPYKVFMSIGAIVDHFECSICGKDIDGLECMHRRGQLYAGKLAYGIAKNILKLDHASLVLDPDDKRCVVELPNDAEHFPILEYIRESRTAGDFTIIGFRRLQWSKRTFPNPDFRKLGRNDRCFCGSGRKFKGCCIGKATLEKDHVDLIGGSVDIARTVV